MPASSRRILLGEIIGVHGIRGEVVIRSYAESADSLDAYGPLEDETGGRRLDIEVVRVTPKGVVARIKSVADRTAAEKLKGTKLYVARDRLPDTEAGTFYHVDLIGLDAIDPKGMKWGSIVAVHNFGAGDLVEIALSDTKDTVFVPFSDACVPNVDIPGKKAVIILPVASPADDGELDTNHDRS